MDTNIAVFDMSASRNSPAGSCVLYEIEGLRKNYRITVFSERFDGQQDKNMTHVFVPLPKRPLFLRYPLFQVLAAFRYLVWRVSNARPFLIQTTQGQFLWADVAYAHFCHGAYLKNQWRQSTATGARRLARWLNHKFNASMERIAFKRARKIVVPSLGLHRELAQTYPNVADKIVVIANPVDLDRFARPSDFDRASSRAEFGYVAEHVVFVFMALGDFSRKGLGLILPALAQLPPQERDRARLLVVGGGEGEIAQYQALADELGLGAQVRFAGMQRDVRPYLWVADVFAFPSAYEIFSLAILQAAAAGLPPIVSQGLYGAEEFVRHRENGWVVPRDVDSVCGALGEAIRQSEDLSSMAQAAIQSVQVFSDTAFVTKWEHFYAGLAASGMRAG
jgi:glycosyltransferase involved in cell wall biosynthesis